MYILKEIFYILIVMLILIGATILIIGTSVLSAPILLGYALYILIRDYKVDRKYKKRKK